MTPIVRYTQTHTRALAVLALLLFTESATAQLLSVSSLRMSVAPRATDGTSNTIATLGQASDGTVSLIVRSFDRRTGFQQGTPFIGLLLPAVQKLKFNDVLVSVVFEPNDPIAGVQHVLVLDSDRRVHVYPLGFMPDGTPFLAAPIRIIGPLGPPEAGEGTVLGEAPNPANPDDPFLAVGTMKGQVIVTRLLFLDGSVRFALGDGSVRFSIQDLGPIPQVGYFALGAVSNGALVLINPDGEINEPGLQPIVTALLRDPRRFPLIDFGAPLLNRDSQPLDAPTPVRIVTANGTVDLVALGIPDNTVFGGVMTVQIIEPVCLPVKQVVFNSLTWLPIDGSGVLYNAGFTLEDGLVGRTWTIAGASMDVAPERLNLGSSGRFVTVRIEAENNHAATIDVATLSLSVDGAIGAVPGSAHPAPRLLQFDGDLNIDLEAKFDRGDLIALLGQTSGPTAIVRASWQYGDGTAGTSSAQVKVKR